MPRIHHLALWVADLDAICAFYAGTFGAEIGPLYQNPAKGFRSRFLSFGPGAAIEVMASSTLTLAPQAAGSQRMGFTAAGGISPDLNSRAVIARSLRRSDLAGS